MEADKQVFASFIGGSTILSSCHGEGNISNSELVPVVSPATNKPVLYFLPADDHDVNRAVLAAHEAFTCTDETTSWSLPSRSGFRAEVLTKIATELRLHTDRLADLEVKQISRPKKEMRFQLSRLPEWFEYYASLLRVRHDLVTPFGAGYLNTVCRVPLGVVVQITPFNHPLLITIKKLAPALAAGNTVVIKPSEMAPATAIEFAEICAKAGLPSGVLQVVLGKQEVGKQLVSHHLVAKVDFTGGPVTGRSIGQAAGANLCAFTAELGGKAPMIVFGPSHTADNKYLDSYLDPIVNGCAFGAFIASGQTCIAGTRILIQHSIYDVFKKKLVAKTKSFRMGDPESLETTIGPVISKRQLSFIHDTVQNSLTASKGSLELLCGGKQYRDFEGAAAPFNDGNYYEPTVVAAKAKIADLKSEGGIELVRRLHHSTAVFQEEMFGPVVALIPFWDESHAIGLANDSRFSLGCSIWTENLVQAHATAQGVKAGIIWINDHHKNHPSSPWGGLGKESGIGRENGLDAFHEYSQTKSVVTNCNHYNTDWFKDANARYN